MTDEERGAFERIQETEPAWKDVAVVIRFLARERLAQEAMWDALSELHDTPFLKNFQEIK